MIVITKLIMLGIVVVCCATLAFILFDFVADEVDRVYSKKRNRVHFYVARNKDRKLFLYLGKPIRSANVFCGNIDEGVYIMTHNYFENFGLNENDYKDLKWEDEPVEVFVNMED